MNIYMRSEGSCCLFSYLKVLLGGVAVGLFIWLLIVGSPERGGRPLPKTTSWPVAGSLKQEKVLTNINNHPQLELNFISKVKVPKGPDPIHNRRVGVKGGPPSRD